MVLVEPQVVHVHTEVNVEAAVAIIVGHGSVRERSLWRTGKLEGVGLHGKGPVALIEKEHGTGAANDEKVLKSRIPKVDEQGAGGIVEHAHSGLFRYVFKGSVALVAVKTIGQSRGLAEIEIVEAVVVEVAHGSAVVGVNVHADRAVKDRAPIVGAVKQLLVVRFGRSESLVRDVNKHWPARNAQRLLAGFPSLRQPTCCFIARPLGAP